MTAMSIRSFELKTPLSEPVRPSELEVALLKQTHIKAMCACQNKGQHKLNERELTLALRKLLH